MTKALDADHLRSWIGRNQAAEDVVSQDLVTKFRATLDLTKPEGKAAEIAPQLIHFCLGQPSAPTASLGPDGHPARGGFLPPVPLPRRMWAGGEVVFHDDLKVGDAVQRVSTISDVVLKEGRTGLLCFVTVQHVISVDGEVRVEERQDIVYRGEGGSAPVQPPAPQGQRSRLMGTSVPLLFRYSALTFNGHRIHYDRRYTMEVEGYPGLIVHGPLQATALCHFAAELKGRAPNRLSFRSTGTLFDIDTAFVHAEDKGDHMALWTARDGGPVAMSGQAYWA
jgi:3-methylfumaryl-CoA hydratase